eukprot:scaffold645511_cov27-Prasinocladus_malaysianus.AAC.1
MRAARPRSATTILKGTARTGGLRSAGPHCSIAQSLPKSFWRRVNCRYKKSQPRALKISESFLGTAAVVFDMKLQNPVDRRAARPRLLDG